MDREPLPSFRTLLNQYMTDKGMTTTKLAEKIGVAGITVRRWLSKDEDERVEKPRRKHVVAIAKTLRLNLEEKDKLLLSAGCPPEFFIKSDGSKQPPPESSEPTKKLTPFPLINKPIIHPSQFFGRVEILDRIRNSIWRQPDSLQHIALIGKRCSGKTSLLNYLKNISNVSKTELREDQPQGWEDWLPTDFQFVLVDFRLVGMRQPENLLRHILEQLHLKIPEPCDVINFSATLNEQLNKPTVILMDEIGVGLQAPDLDKAFWWNLRELGGNCADGKLGFVVTAHEAIEKLAEDHGKPSPFFNIFGYALCIEALTKIEALSLVKSFSPPILEEDTAWILQESGCWPIMLQILCEARLRTLEKGDTTEAWKTEGLERIQPYLYLLQP